MFEQESLQNESMEKYIWNQPLEHPKMVSTKWESTTPFFRTNPARHKMMVYAGHVPTHFMPEISRGIIYIIYKCTITTNKILCGYDLLKWLYVHHGVKKWIQFSMISTLVALLWQGKLPGFGMHLGSSCSVILLKPIDSLQIHTSMLTFRGVSA